MQKGRAELSCRVEGRDRKRLLVLQRGQPGLKAVVPEAACLARLSVRLCVASHPTSRLSVRRCVLARCAQSEAGDPRA